MKAIAILSAAFAMASALAAPAPVQTGATQAARFDIRSPDGAVMLAAGEIRSYAWATHTLTLAPTVRGGLEDRLRQLGRLVSGVPFGVAVSGTIIYSGSFISCASSRTLATVVIVVDAQIVEPQLKADELRIQLGYPGPDFFKGTDPRGDLRIKEALRADGKLQESELLARSFAWPVR